MRLTFLLLLLIGVQTSFAQLPDDWFGNYSGELETVDIKGIQMSYHMELQISRSSDTSYNFVIIYGEDSTRQERKYMLYDNGPNRFALDEQNGIILEMSMGFDRLYSVFEVQGALLHIAYIKQKKGIRFELTSSKVSFNTGNSEEGGEKTPLVVSYKTTNFQQANLKKTK